MSDNRDLFKKKDAELFAEVEKMKVGTSSDFGRLYELSKRYIYKIIHDIVQDDYATEDLMQETYLQIYSKISTLQESKAFYVWAGRIATNLTLRYIQKNRHEVLAEADDEGNTDYVFENASEDYEEFIPEAVLLDREKQRILAEILDGLSAEQKLCVQYYYYEEMSVREIADTLNCSDGTVKSRLNYARKSIKTAIENMNITSGTRFYSISGISFFWLLFREITESVTVPLAIDTALSAVSATGVAYGAPAAGGMGAAYGAPGANGMGAAYGTPGANGMGAAYGAPGANGMGTASGAAVGKAGAAGAGKAGGGIGAKLAIAFCACVAGTGVALLVMNLLDKREKPEQPVEITTEISTTEVTTDTEEPVTEEALEEDEIIYVAANETRADNGVFLSVSFLSEGGEDVWSYPASDPECEKVWEEYAPVLDGAVMGMDAAAGTYTADFTALFSTVVVETEEKTIRYIPVSMTGQLVVGEAEETEEQIKIKDAPKKQENNQNPAQPQYSGQSSQEDGGDDGQEAPGIGGFGASIHTDMGYDYYTYYDEDGNQTSWIQYDDGTVVEE